MCICAEEHKCSQMLEANLGSVQLKLLDALSCFMQVLGTDLGSFAKVEVFLTIGTSLQFYKAILDLVLIFVIDIISY